LRRVDGLTHVETSHLGREVAVQRME